LEATRIISSSMEITKLLLGKRTPVPAMTVIAVWLHLRPLRRIRRSRHSRDRGHHRGQVVDAISIRERPAEVEDRAIPGHWEGDLLGGSTAVTWPLWWSAVRALSCWSRCPARRRRRWSPL
jgi:hypothetical protein